MRICRVNDLAEEDDLSTDKISTSSGTPQESAIQRLYELRNEDKNYGSALLAQHFKAMMIKRILYYRRRWNLFIPQLIVPVLYMALFTWTATTFPSAKEQSPLKIDFSPYYSQGKSARIFFGGSNIDSKIESEINATAYGWTSDLKLNLTNINGDEGALQNAMVDGIKNVCFSTLI